MVKKKVFNIGNALSHGLTETIAAANQYSGELRIEIIPIQKIEVDPDNPRDFTLTLNDLSQGISPSDPACLRKMEEKQSLETLAASIKEQGILNPVIVYKLGQKYRLIAGERRTLASLMAGKNDIQAKIIDLKPDPLKIGLLQWIENMERTDLTLWERLKNLEKIVVAYAHHKRLTIEQVTITELSYLMGCTKPHAMNYKAVLMSDQQIQSLIKENKIKNLEKAALLSSIKSSEIRQNAIQACLQGAHLKKLKWMADFENESKSKTNLVNPFIERRGRQSKTIHFGTTNNIQVARLVIDSVLKNEGLSSLADYFKEIDWNDYKAMTQTFKQLIRKLEKLNVK